MNPPDPRAISAAEKRIDTIFAQFDPRTEQLTMKHHLYQLVHDLQARHAAGPPLPSAEKAMNDELLSQGLHEAFCIVRDYSVESRGQCNCRLRNSPAGPPESPERTETKNKGEGMEIQKLAMIVHEANRAYCIAIGDNSQPRWEDAPEWQKESAVKGIEFRRKNPEASAASMHQSWLDEKMRTGWKYGKVKNPETKEHPCFVPYVDLPDEQKTKDHLFSAVLDAVTGAWDEST